MASSRGGGGGGLPFRESQMCQSFSSVPRTYIRTADELEPLSPGARLASLPSLGASPHHHGRASMQSPLMQQHFDYRQPGMAMASSSRQMSLSPMLMSPHHPHAHQQPPKALPPALAKSSLLTMRPSARLPPKNLDEFAPLTHQEKEPPGTGLFSKCVLCLLLNAVFVLTLFLAFLIGHFAAEAHLPSNRTNSSTASTSAPPFSAVVIAPPSAASGGHQQQSGNVPSASTTDQHQQAELEFRKNMERHRQRVPALREVYPPQLDAEAAELWEDDEAAQVLLMPQSPAYQLGNGPVVHRSQIGPAPDMPLIPLPRTVYPRHYSVDLDLTEFYGIVEPPQVRGNLSILLEAFGNATDDELIFHAATNIFIHRIRLFRQTGEQGRANAEVRSVKRHPDRELIRLVLGERLKAGWYWLEMEFRTRICQSEAEGAHCFPGPASTSTTDSQDPDGSGSNSGHALIAGFATKFEPNFARTFLPGWDEPRFRSTFNVSIRHFSDCRVLSNMAPMDGSANSNDNQKPMGAAFVRTSRFGPTPPMPLYLLAFATGPFAPLEVRTSRGNVSMSVWTAPQDTLAAHFVANFSPAMFDRLQEDFGVRYPLPKLDFFLTPRFPVGGMENWGLIVLHADTVRLLSSSAVGGDASSSSLPLTVDGSSSKEEQRREHQQRSLLAVDALAEQYRVEKVITHELVHQWFGNLVSVWDWEELWLSEGFASYFVFDFLNALQHPLLTEHEYYLRLIELCQRQSTDGRSALVRPLRSARQLDRLFDGVQLYTKGAVAVKMLKDLVGPAEFRVGVARFLRDNALQAIDRSALWAAFPTHADHGADTVRLRDAMEPWLLNTGIPELEVARSYEDQSIRLQQRQADVNRHLVYLDDEAMQQMRLALGGEEGRQKRGQRRSIEEEKGRRRRRRSARKRRHSSRRRTGQGRRAAAAALLGLAEQSELYSEREQATREDIDGILRWMADEFDINGSTVFGNGSGEEEAVVQQKSMTAATAASSSSSNGQQRPFDEAMFSWPTAADGPEAEDEKKQQRRQQGRTREDQQGRRRHHQKGSSSNGHSRSRKFGAARRGQAKKDQRRTAAEEERAKKNEMMMAGCPQIFSLRETSNSKGKSNGNGGDGEPPVAATTNRIRFLATPQSRTTPSSPPPPERSRQLRAGHGKAGTAKKTSTTAASSPLWPIPFSYAFGSVRSPRGQTVRQFWLLNDTVRFVDVGLDREQFLLANPHWVYAYRVNYDLQNWRILITQLHKNHQEIPAMSRMQLLVDAECFLRESAQPQLFVQMLSYLAHEDDLGVLLVGLDSLHSLLELFSASEVFGPLLVHMLPAIRQLDRQLALAVADGTDPELGALWLLSPLRLAKLYQLRCAANLGSCAESKQVRKWLSFPTALAADNHQQLAAICQHLFTHAGPSEVSLLAGLLKQPNSATFAAVIRQMASRCVQDEALVRQAVGHILRTRNAIVYCNALNNAYSIHYNRKFRELFWTGLAQQLNVQERQILFAVSTGKSDRMARQLLHSIRSLAELNLVERVILTQWPDSLRVQMEYLRRKLAWAEREASEQIRKYLVLEETTRQKGNPTP